MILLIYVSQITYPGFYLTTLIQRARSHIPDKMPLKNLLRKKDKIKENDTPSMPVTPPANVPEFRFVRTDTTSQEVIQPPDESSNFTSPKRQSRFRRGSNNSSKSAENELSPPREKGERRLSQRLHLDRRSRSSSTASANVPADLPAIGADVSNAQDREAQWEQRATLLVQRNPNSRRSSAGGGDVMVEEFSNYSQQQQSRSRSTSVGRVNDPEGDV